MPVNVIGTLKPKNNGKFPVAEAVDIKVTDGLRLDKALENKADLSTVNFALGGKADNSDITNLQNQINEIAQAAGTGSADTEVAQARVDAEGVSHTTLKARCDSDYLKNKQARIELINAEADLNNLKLALINNTDIVYNLISSVVQGGFSYDTTQKTIALTESDVLCRTGYIDISQFGTNDEFTLVVPDGFKALLFQTDSTSGTYTSGGTTGWKTSDATIVKSAGVNYVIIEVGKVNNTNISPSECNVKLVAETETAYSRSIAELTSDVADLEAKISNIDVSANSTEVIKVFSSDSGGTKRRFDVSDIDYFHFQINSGFKNSISAEIANAENLYSGFDKADFETDGVSCSKYSNGVKISGTASANINSIYFFGSSTSNADNITISKNTDILFDSSIPFSTTTIYAVIYKQSGTVTVNNTSVKTTISADDIIYGIRFQIMNGTAINDYVKLDIIESDTVFKSVPCIREDSSTAQDKAVLYGNYCIDVRGYTNLELNRSSWSSAGTYSLDVDRIIKMDSQIIPYHSFDSSPLPVFFDTEEINTGSVKVMGVKNGNLLGAVIEGGKCNLTVSNANYENFSSVSQIGTETELPINMELSKNCIFVLGKSGILWRSTDNGETWTDVLELRKSAQAEQIYIHVYLPGAFQQIATNRKGIVVVSEYRRPERHDTPYSGDNADGGKIYLSTDDGETFSTIFDIAVNIGAVTTQHIHSINIDPYDNTIWAVLGDWPNQRTIWSTDLGTTWNGLNGNSLYGNQYTAALPMSDCVIFGTDSHCVGFSRYLRTGAKVSDGENIRADVPCNIHEYSAGTDAIQPVFGRAGYNSKTNIALFGYFVSVGNTETAYYDFKKGAIYATNGQNFIKAYESIDDVLGGVTSCYYDDYHDCYIARLGTEYNNPNWSGKIVMIKIV